MTTRLRVENLHGINCDITLGDFTLFTGGGFGKTTIIKLLHALISNDYWLFGTIGKTFCVGRDIESLIGSRISFVSNTELTGHRETVITDGVIESFKPDKAAGDVVALLLKDYTHDSVGYWREYNLPRRSKCQLSGITYTKNAKGVRYHNGVVDTKWPSSLRAKVNLNDLMFHKSATYSAILLDSMDYNLTPSDAARMAFLLAAYTAVCPVIAVTYSPYVTSALSLVSYACNRIIQKDKDARSKVTEILGVITPDAFDLREYIFKDGGVERNPIDETSSMLNCHLDECGLDVVDGILDRLLEIVREGKEGKGGSNGSI